MEDLIKIFVQKHQNLTKNLASEADFNSSCIDPDPKQEKYIQAYIQTLSEVINNSKDTTIEGLYETVENISENLLKELIIKGTIPKNRICITIEAISEVMDKLIHRYISKKIGENLSQLKHQLVTMVNNVYYLTQISNEKISQRFSKILDNGARILVYGYNSQILSCLVYSRRLGKKFTVNISEYNDNDLSKFMYEELKKNDISCKLIPAVSVAYHLMDIDIVLTGADAVCENGGIINKIGTFTTSICAKNFKKSLYVITDSLKFLKVYALDQKDLEQKLTDKYFILEEPIIDYTPPEFINMFITDIGIMTPSAISDELIQLFYN